MSCVTILALAKGVQNGGDEVDVFVRVRAMNSFFFVTGQIGMKFGKRQSVSSTELKNSEKCRLRA